MTAGLNRLDIQTGSVSTYRHSESDPASLAADGVMTLFEDSAGRIWGGHLRRWRIGARQQSGCLHPLSTRS